MKLTKTIVLKLREGAGEGESDLEDTINAFAEGMNYASEIVYRHNKPISSVSLQKLSYRYLRDNIGLKSQMACNVCRQVSGAYKSLKEKIKVKRAKWQLLTFAPTNVTFSYGRDFTINRDMLSITTLRGRKKYQIVNYRYAEQFFDGSWKYLASKLVKHKDGHYYFHLSCEKEIEELDITKVSNFMGVDVGMNYLAVATTTDKKNRFFRGGDIKNVRNIYEKQRERLQKKGTRSAKRVLKRLSGREKRLIRDINHVVSKEVVEFAKENGVEVIGMEDLTGIRERTKVRKNQRYRHNSWAFRQLQTFIEYKAKEARIKVVYVTPKYTSQTCPRCKHISRNNRKGREFRCEVCGYELNADLVGARNIEERTRAFRHDLEAQGCVVDQPDENSLEESLKPANLLVGN
ncbi:MAG: transposase [Chloroflexi bacterium]|nr:MAG: transposase [Chloroflexota bacterium]